MADTPTPIPNGEFPAGTGGNQAPTPADVAAVEAAINAYEATGAQPQPSFAAPSQPAYPPAPAQPTLQPMQAVPSQTPYNSTAYYARQSSQAYQGSNAPGFGYNGGDQGFTYGYDASNPYAGTNAAWSAPTAAYPTAAQPPSATGSIVCGVLAILFCWIPIVGPVLAIVAIALGVKHTKTYGKAGSATAGKATGIIGLILSALLTVAGIALTLAVVEEMQSYDYSDWNRFIEEFDESYDVEGTTGGYLSANTSEDVKALAADAEQLMQSLAAPTGQLKEQLEAQADASFAMLTDCTLSDCGISADDNLAWYLDGMTYAVDSNNIYVLGSTAEVFVNVRIHDGWELYEEFYKEYTDIVANVNTDAMTDAEYKAYLKSSYEKAQADTDDYRNASLYLTYTKTADGAWELDADNLDNELYTLFNWV